MAGVLQVEAPERSRLGDYLFCYHEDARAQTAISLVYPAAVVCRYLLREK